MVRVDDQSSFDTGSIPAAWGGVIQLENCGAGVSAAPQLKMILNLFLLIDTFESVFKVDYVSKEKGRGCRFTSIDVKTAGDNLRLFRSSLTALWRLVHPAKVACRN
jgi:hypothetical protein